MHITRITARQIIDSRGIPTVEADVYCGNTYGCASVPSGTSTGSHEARELRDIQSRLYNGRGVANAVANITDEIQRALIGMNPLDQESIDMRMIELDGTPHKSRLGANALLAVSLATARVASKLARIPLYEHINHLAQSPTMRIPLPMFNMLQGGSHSQNGSDIQEYMIMPRIAQNYAHAVRMASEIFTALTHIRVDRGMPTTIGLEGGYDTTHLSNRTPLDLLSEACINAGYMPGTDIEFCLDVAASEFYNNNNYILANETANYTSQEMIAYITELVSSYPIRSIEDGLSEDDWSGWQELTLRLPRTQLVGDDIYVTHIDRLTQAIEQKAGNTILIKPNQAGTLTETLQVISHAHAHKWQCVISHRSGDTEDTFISHLAVGTGARYIKTGNITRGERTAKHNELMRIEEENPTVFFAQS